ncbi:ECF RNA polymerase sigma factor SigK [Arthrobacter sp. zg-ZUI100]|uniref:ECF RNA polymerase sigma factor SigK n=1 Tax=Arthrobacter jiangjiafuii TaxID=2817475 RepID=A0A975R0D3_9MICC|nr:ECF RNA polymerase sigma factor SigK [Arthrobacter jiangjiafuii]MBP3034841.1 ECF RNA polymerase sigma factor SigK [Arthrobacter jiangjiafuii]MBP3044579.1 ECF RNA polymerase sigma factor SigK [Arthrobacter jiangjiafuii]QWC09319.1 ECF RNA polymerase sigma factor SigK [Arthrobacter jiangjiafuii]
MDTSNQGRHSPSQASAAPSAGKAAGNAAAQTGPHTPLEDLLAGIARGSQDDFAAFYAQTSRRVYGLARRVLIDAELSEDTTQEVYLQVWTNAARFDPALGSPLAWLLTLAHRRAVDRVRSEQSSANREARYGAAMQEPDYDNVVDTVTQRLDAEAVTACLQSLTDTQRESVRLAYYGGLTYREVAEKLNAAVPTIKSRIRDGLIRLKNCLGVNADAGEQR